MQLVKLNYTIPAELCKGKKGIQNMQTMKEVERIETEGSGLSEQVCKQSVNIHFLETVVFEYQRTRVAYGFRCEGGLDRVWTRQTACVTE